MLPPDGPDAPLAARVIRRIGMGPRRVIGIYHEGESGGRIAAIDKRTDRDWQVAPGDRAGAREGELVEAEQVGAAARPRPAAGAHRRPARRPLGAAVGLADRHPRARHPRRVPRGRRWPRPRPRGPVPLGEREDLRALPLRHHRPVRRARPRRRGLRPSRRRPGEPRRPRRLGGDRRRRRLRPPRHRARPRGAPPRQLDLLPRPGRADAARPAVGRPLLADRRRRPALHRRAPRARRRRPQARPPLHPRR